MSGLYSHLLSELQCVSYNVLGLELSQTPHETLKDNRFRIEQGSAMRPEILVII